MPSDHAIARATRRLRKLRAGGADAPAPRAPIAPPAPAPAADAAVDPVAAAIDVLGRVAPGELQAYGWHFQKVDYYSALNDIGFLRANPDLWHNRPLPQGIDWDLDAQLERVRAFAPYIAELGDVPWDAPTGRPAFHWDNAFWRGADALAHYGLLRHLKPRRVVEVGCGWSSLLLDRALAANEAGGAPRAVVDQIEPYPRHELLAALPDHWQLHEAPLQRAPLEPFEALGSGDVCFYDGSHVTKPGSDVNWFFFEIMPRLAPGVVVHLHDIFWPGDYPDEWIFERGQTWNEQYVLQAFLMYNAEFDLLLANQALFRERADGLTALYGDVPDGVSGVSVWLQRRPLDGEASSPMASTSTT